MKLTRMSRCRSFDVSRGLSPRLFDMKNLLLLYGWLILVSVASADWPQFRGPDGQGHAAAVDLPTNWDEVRHVRWKRPVPGRGLSSPVIRGDQIWMTTARDEGHSLRALCFAADSGNLVREIELFRAADAGPLHAKNSYATPTPVIGDAGVYFHFGMRGTASLSHQGEVLWKNDRLRYHQPYSAASSPVMFSDRLFLTCDGGDEQFVVALSKRSGNVIWSTPRAHNEAARVRSRTGARRGYATMSYSTPLVVRANAEYQLVSPGADLVAAYDVKTGEELWWYGYDGFSLVARPVFGHGLVYVVGVVKQGRHELYAIRPESRGQLKEEDLAWRLTQNCPHVPSPLLIDEYLYLIRDNGVASCVDAKTGEIEWQQRLGGNYSASPIYADGKIYCFSEEGKTTVILPGPKFEQLAVNQLEGRILASPAVTGNSLIIRTDTHLYRLEKKSSGAIPSCSLSQPGDVSQRFPRQPEFVP